jgi:hypothetical protein
MLPLNIALRGDRWLDGYLALDYAAAIPEHHVPLIFRI